MATPTNPRKGKHMALSALQIQVLNLLTFTHNWEDRAVSHISKKTNKSWDQISQAVRSAITSQIFAVADGANTDAARAAILPHLQMEVDGLKKHGKEYISNLI